MLPAGGEISIEASKETLRLGLPAREGCRIPKDFGSAWYVALDAKGEVVAHGPLDGGSGEPRAYEEKDLQALDAPLSRDFPLPKGARRIQVGLLTAEGTLLSSPPLDLP